MKLYVATAGSYSDYHIVGIYDSETDANLVASRLDDGDVLSMDLNAPNTEHYRLPVWTVDISPDNVGRVKQCYYASDYEDSDRLNSVRYVPDDGYLRSWVAPPFQHGYHTVKVRAATDEHAKKIAYDLIAQYRAEQEGIA